VTEPDMHDDVDLIDKADEGEAPPGGERRRRRRHSTRRNTIE